MVNSITTTAWGVHLEALGCNGSNRVGHAIIAGLGIHRGDGQGYLALLGNIHDQAMVEGHLNGLMILLAPINLAEDPVIMFSPVHQMLGEHQSIKEIKIRLHKQNGPEPASS